MNKLTTVVVAAGRTVAEGEIELIQEDWTRFHCDVVAELETADANIVLIPRATTTYTGYGTWKGRITEEAAAWIAIVPAANVDALKHRLAGIGLKYHQETLGFVVAEGENNLILCAIDSMS